MLVFSGGVVPSREACREFGRRGFRATTIKWFMGRTDWHKNWLRAAGASCDVIHPSRLTPGAFHLLFIYHLHPDKFKQFVPYLMDDDLHCLEAVVFGCVRGRKFWEVF